MLYWIILGALAVVALVLFFVIIRVILKERGYSSDYDEDDYEEDARAGRSRKKSRNNPKKSRKEYDDEYGDEDEYDEEYDEEYDDEYGDEEDDYVTGRPNHFRPGSPSGGPDAITSHPPRPRQRRKQWKIVLENLDTWEKHGIIFYDNIGIGRARSNPDFEKYLSVKDDPRVSKLHCAIIRKDDRLYLKDMEARNGTFLNGRMIQKPVTLQKEDVIGVGETRLEVKQILRERD